MNDLTDNFSLTAQIDKKIDPNQIIGYMRVAIQSLVDAMARGPQTLATTLSILPDNERRRVIESFNATMAPYPQEKLIHQYSYVERLFVSGDRTRRVLAKSGRLGDGKLPVYRVDVGRNQHDDYDALPAIGFFYSGHGCQYSGYAFGRRCVEANIVPSMGTVGDAVNYERHALAHDTP